MNSSMIVTEPLDESAWQEIGWSGRETIGDSAHVYMYAQRTADGRIAIGGRGIPYRFASGVDDRGVTQPEAIDTLGHILRALFPAAARRPHRPCLVRRPRRSPRLVRDGHGRSGLRAGLGRGLHRPRGRRRQPGRAHARRPGGGGPHRPDRPSLGRSPDPPLGAGTAALGGRAWPLRPVPGGRQRRRRRLGADISAGPHRGPDLRHPVIVAGQRSRPASYALGPVPGSARRGRAGAPCAAHGPPRLASAAVIRRSSSAGSAAPA